jgi:hypothetical protein
MDKDDNFLNYRCGFDSRWDYYKKKTYNMNTLTINDVKKDLYKSKVNAKFSHYCAGKNYYTVELSDGLIFQFPIKTTEIKSISLFDLIKMKITDIDILNEIEPLVSGLEHKQLELSSDLGNTPFNNEIKASELNRWISKAFDKGEFICINKAPEIYENQN